MSSSALRAGVAAHSDPSSDVLLSPIGSMSLSRRGVKRSRVALGDEGELTIVATNGDLLRGTHGDGVSLSPRSVVDLQDSFTFVSGGTGRFATASGGGIEFGIADLSDG
jgi:hypothetical protein